jgi:rhamnosyl/mannosyltransferase
VGSRPLRVCHLGKYYPPALGGMESHVRTLARAQAALGVEAAVVCVQHADRRGRDVTWQTFAATETVEEWDGPVRVTRLGRRACLARLDLCPQLPGLLARLKPGAVDVVHLQVPNPTMLLSLAAVRCRVPLVITYQSDVIKQKALGMGLRPFEHLVFRRAAAILCSSPYYAGGSPLLKRYAGKVGVLPLGIDLEPFLRPGPAALEHARRILAEHGQPLWLAVGRLVYYKGLDVALRALARVPGKLLVIGDGPLEKELKKLARDLNVADRVQWRGRVSAEELVGAYHAATALWFPSNARSEGFGLVQVESMACGCPVLNTNIPCSGVSWVSLHEETGLTVPVNDPQALARAAQRLWQEPTLRERLGRGARDRAGREFDHRRMASRSLALYRQVLTRKPAAPGGSPGVTSPSFSPPLARDSDFATC